VVGAWSGAGGTGVLWVGSQAVAPTVVGWDGIRFSGDVVGCWGYEATLAGCHMADPFFIRRLKVLLHIK
jgi:hypothetical protein